MPDWRQDVIRALGGRITPAALRLLGAWQPWEGGHTRNRARFNWLNTTRGDEYPSINRVGVRAFPDYQTGVRQTAATLHNYPALVQALASGQVDFTDEGLQADFNKWLTGNATPGMSDYVRKIAGSFGQAPGQRSRAPATAGAAAPPSPAPAPVQPDPVRMRRRKLLAGLLSEEGERVGTPPPLMLIQRLLTIDPAAEADALQDGGTVRPPVDPRTQDVPGLSAADKLNPKLKKALQVAHAQLGKPYVWGAESPREGGFDCSGLVDFAFKQAGIKIPGRLTTWTAARLGRSVKGQELRPGDWIISNRGRHMTLYVGGGKVIAAPRRGTVVQYQGLPEGIVDVRRFV